MPGPTTRIDLIAEEQCQLQGWVRAGTTAQRLAQRARLILGVLRDGDRADWPSKRASVAPRCAAGSPASWSTAAQDSRTVHAEVGQHASVPSRGH